MSAALNRRRFLRLSAAALSALGALASGCATRFGAREGEVGAKPFNCASPGQAGVFDYIVVGSGAGGGPLAANLTRAGFRVLLLEAGGSEDSLTYQVPAFHALASEDERYAWNFYVRHYADDAQQQRDPKYIAERDGVLYPRCATVGGCTAHNAMIFVYPHNADWDRIAELTGDPSWSRERMRVYFERLEQCQHPVSGAAQRHGFGGWLKTNVASPLLMARDRIVQQLVLESVAESLGPLQGRLDRVQGRLRQGNDPNAWSFVSENATGLCMTPMTTDGVRRVGSRERLRDAEIACPHLVVQTHALVTRIVLDAQRRATGVEYLAGEHLYRADPRFAATGTAQTAIARAAREVIVCAGAFNSPQLLMLSGIGPRADLEALGLPVHVDLPGVGRNLQDRYEISVVSRAKGEFALMRDMTLRPPGDNESGDAPFREWRAGKGPYTTNGAVIAMVKRSTVSATEPDLFVFALLGSFTGYFPCYSQKIVERRDTFTWAILKGHTRNTNGYVKLRSADPRDTPEINFHFFSGPGSAEDLDAVAEAVETARSINGRCGDVIEEEVVPGPRYATREQVREYIRDHAWGHHACGTCKIGRRDDPMAVVDGDFRVFGIQGLRVVDASVFPKIPGFFIACPVYMISEKAADVIMRDAGNQPATGG